MTNIVAVGRNHKEQNRITLDVAQESRTDTLALVCTLDDTRNIRHNENWVDLKNQCNAKAATKIIEIESDKQAERMKRLLNVSDMLLLAVEDAVKKFQTEELMLDKGALKSLSGTIKDIKDIQSLKTSLDIEEQKARIAILKKQAEADKFDDEKPHGVVLMPPIMDDLTPPKEDDNG